MTKKQLALAATIVANIRANHWTNIVPQWANPHDVSGYPVTGYARAVQTAEAFVFLFHADDRHFNESAFLRACGLLEKTKASHAC